MGQLYNDIYKVGNLFQENKYQKIYMGESIEDSNIIIVINEFVKSNIIDDSFIDILKNKLDHLLYFEETDKTATFITKYDEGMSIFQVVENIPNTTNFRTNILHDYLNKLKDFDNLLPVFQYILASHSQFFIKDNNDLIHNELIIIDEEHFDPTMSFDTVKHRISTFAQKMLDYTPADEDKQLIITLKGFFGDLKSDLSLNSLKKIYFAYKKIYIYDMYLDKNSSSSTIIPPVIPTINVNDTSKPNIEVDNTAPKEKFHLPFKDNKILLFNKEKYAINPLYVALIIMALSIALFAIFIPMIDRISDTDIPIASFEKDKTEDQWKFLNMSKTFGNNNKIEEVEWKVYSNEKLFSTFDTYNLNLSFKTEGIYKISLRVMDSYGNWSNEYFEEIYHTSIDYNPIDGENSSNAGTEPLNSYTIDFEGTPTFDTEEVRSGDKSIKMIFDDDQTHSIVLNKIFIDNNTIISFWIKASDDPPLTFTVSGINNNNDEDDEVFSISKIIHPNIDQWQHIEFNANSTLADTLKIMVNGDTLTLWIDDIEINSYK